MTERLRRRFADTTGGAPTAPIRSDELRDLPLGLRDPLNNSRPNLSKPAPRHRP
jgi:hypothetical protein